MTSGTDLCAALRAAIENSIPGATVEVTATTPGHFEIRVISEAFSGKTRVAQQQLVYGAIGHFLSGDQAPVHAIDRLETKTPQIG